ncbi:Flp pilus assembly complex ATPase component TadA [Aerococcaceae bacterium DSM 111020]|nr:Flp pilus assembly complex ATPase component TadA [Aerococcaceae bacterium DSM 111020]
MIEQEAEQLITQANDAGVSDIHLLPGENGYESFFRINGALNLFDKHSFEWGKRLISYFKFLANMDVGERRKPQSGSCALTVAGNTMELRFSTITNVKLYESLVIRILKQSRTNGASFRTYFPKNQTILRQLVRRKSGLILFSGPVGSGKTTTIYQLLRERIQDEPLQVITMEDPVEIYEPRFLQTEVNLRSQVTYDVLIKASLRHHPDILMIGEIRDEETARMAIRGALTGHLMIATIHAKNAIGVLGRLQELQITSQQLSQTLIGIISQRLIPRYCELCDHQCSQHCSHIPKDLQRLALLEILHGSALELNLQRPNTDSYQTLNKELRRAWSLGFINEKAFTHYELV